MVPPPERRLFAWVAFALLVPVALIGARTAPYLSAIAGFTLCAVPHNLSELTFFFAGRGGVGTALPKAPRWALMGLIFMMTPGFLYLIPGLLSAQQKLSLFSCHMAAIPLWIGAMALAAPLRPMVRVGLFSAGLAASALAWKAPLIASVVVAHGHHVTALILTWLILRDRPDAEKTLARPLFLAVVVAILAGTAWLLLGPAGTPGPQGPPGAAETLVNAIFLDGMTPEMLDRWMAVYAFQLWLHYGVWVMLVPALGLLPSPGPRPVGALAIAVALVLVVGATLLFLDAFAQTRTVYMALAGLHSYGEFPVMLFYRRKPG